MKKFIAGILASIMTVFSVGALSGCDFIDDALGNAIDVELLEKEVDALEKENAALKEELATLKFEVAFPNGLVDEDCVLNSVNIVRDTVDTEHTVVAVRVDGVKVTINGGNYDGGSGSANNVAIFAHNAAEVTINDGTFKVGKDMNGDANSTIYAAGGSTITINGGTFYGVAGADGRVWTLNCQDNSESRIIVKGGTFVGFNPKEVLTEIGGAVSFLADGYDVVKETVDGVDYYKVVEVVEEEVPEVEPEAPSEF